MKRIISLALVLLVLGAGVGAAQTLTQTTAKWNALVHTGRLVSSGSYALSLVTLQADADSSIQSVVIDLTNGSARSPGSIVFTFTWAGMTGGSALSEIDIKPFAHASATATAGAASVFATNGNAVCIGPNYGNAEFPVTLVIGTSAAGSEIGRIMTTIGFVREINQPRFVSFLIDKEGATGKWTAGTFTIGWECYAP
jgi:hypothetical protein